MSDIKTLIVIEMKSGKEKRINSADDADKLVLSMHGDETIGYAFKDIDGTWVLVNVKEFETISFFPRVD